MACYNGELYLDRAIKSVLSQEYRNLELIFVDDCSTDKSICIAKKYTLLDKRVKVYKTEKRSGAGAARNKGIQNSNGEWIGVLDADDMYASEKILRQLNLIRSLRDGIVLVSSDSFQIDINDVVMNRQRYPVSSNKLKKKLIRLKRFPPHSSVLYKASVLKKVGGFDERYLKAQDYDLWLRLIEFGEFVSVNMPLVMYRVHEHGLTKNIEYSFSQKTYAVTANMLYCINKNIGYEKYRTIIQSLGFQEVLGLVSAFLSTEEAVGLLEYKKRMRRLLRGGGGIECFMQSLSVLFDFKNHFNLLAESILHDYWAKKIMIYVKNSCKNN